MQKDYIVKVKLRQQFDQVYKTILNNRDSCRYLDKIAFSSILHDQLLRRDFFEAQVLRSLTNIPPYD